VKRVALSKRDLLWAGAVLPIMALGSRAFAQDTEILGLKLPKEVLDILPKKPLNYLRIADTVIQLEREADRKNLPESPLSLGKGQSLASAVDSLYQLALPRLVALIDRSEAIDIGFADKAGELLAQLHQSQHELPEALRMNASSGDLSLGNRLRSRALYLQEQPIMRPGTGLPDPAPPIEVQPQDDPETAGNPKPPVPESDDAPQPDTPPPKAPDKDDDRDRPLSRARDYAGLKDEYARLYRKLEVRPQYAASANWHAEMMRKSRSRYERVGAQTGVPWFFIAVTHGLEASFNFRAHLHNGDFPLSARTRQVPAGRPTVWLPPSDWESSAKDALRLLGYTGQKDWSLERTLYRLEAYNGLGYRKLGVPTPYLWSFSNQYERGKFVADGRFSNTARSQQCGAAVMLKLLEEAGEIKLTPAA
jgi:lysozyme family protein